MERFIISMSKYMKKIFNYGFSGVKKNLRKKKNLSHIASCASCIYMEDYCNNKEVTEFDMVITETKRFCSFWRFEENV